MESAPDRDSPRRKDDKDDDSEGDGKKGSGKGKVVTKFQKVLLCPGSSPLKTKNPPGTRAAATRVAAAARVSPTPTPPRTSS
jgi:hypothetical protein